MKDEADAKRMFFDYACNSFFMSHDGVYEEYKRYGISEAQEKERCREYIALEYMRIYASRQLKLAQNSSRFPVKS